MAKAALGGIKKGTNRMQKTEPLPMKTSSDQELSRDYLLVGKDSTPDLIHRNKPQVAHPQNDLYSSIPKTLLSKQPRGPVHPPASNNFFAETGQSKTPSSGGGFFNQQVRNIEEEIKAKDEQAQYDYDCRFVVIIAALETVKGFFNDFKRELNQAENRILNFVSNESRELAQRVRLLSGEMTPSHRVDTAEEYRRKVESDVQECLVKAGRCI